MFFSVASCLQVLPLIQPGDFGVKLGWRRTRFDRALMLPWDFPVTQSLLLPMDPKRLRSALPYKSHVWKHCLCTTQENTFGKYRTKLPWWDFWGTSSQRLLMLLQVREWKWSCSMVLRWKAAAWNQGVFVVLLLRLIFLLQNSVLTNWAGETLQPQNEPPVYATCDNTQESPPLSALLQPLGLCRGRSPQSSSQRPSLSKPPFLFLLDAQMWSEVWINTISDPCSDTENMWWCTSFMFAMGLWFALTCGHGGRSLDGMLKTERSHSRSPEPHLPAFIFPSFPKTILLQRHPGLRSIFPKRKDFL